MPPSPTGTAKRSSKDRGSTLKHTQAATSASMPSAPVLSNQALVADSSLPSLKLLVFSTMRDDVSELALDLLQSRGLLRWRDPLSSKLHYLSMTEASLCEVALELVILPPHVSSATHNIPAADGHIVIFSASDYDAAGPVLDLHASLLASSSSSATKFPTALIAFSTEHEEEPDLSDMRSLASSRLGAVFGFVSSLTKDHANAIAVLSDLATLASWHRTGHKVFDPVQAVAELRQLRDVRNADPPNLDKPLPQTIIRAGWLTKQGGKTKVTSRKNWKLRWFILTNDTLSYHKGPAEPAVKTIPLRDVVGFNHSETDSEYVFTVCSPNRNYHIKGETKTEGMFWHGLLRAVKRSLERNAPALRLKGASSFNVAAIPSPTKGQAQRNLRANAALLPARISRPKYMQQLQHAENMYEISEPTAWTEAIETAVITGDLLMPVLPPKHKVSVYISSNFEECELERSMLHTDVQPFLDLLARQLGLEFEFVDPLFNLTEGETGSQMLEEVAVKELQRCLDGSAATAFVALEGSLYGYRTLPASITMEEYSALRAHLVLEYPDEARANVHLLDKWYCVDENAEPASVRLQPVSRYLPVNSPSSKERAAAWASWLEEKERLRRTLVHGAEALVHEFARLRYESSLPHELLRQAVLSNKNRDRQAFVLRRVFQDTAKITSEDKAYATYLAQDDEAKEHLLVLHSKVDQLLSAARRQCVKPSYAPNVGISHKTHGDYLCNMADTICDTIISDILSTYQRRPNDDVVEEVLVHRAIAVENVRCTGFARLDLLENISTFAEEASFEEEIGEQPLIVHGEPGCGKTWLMSHVARTAQDHLPKAVLVLRIIGATRPSSDARSLLHSICTQIVRAYDQDERRIPSSLKDLRLFLRTCMAWATQQKPLIIFLDSFESLAPYDDALDNLSWLPLSAPTPANCRLVIFTASQHRGRDLLNNFRMLCPSPEQYVEVDELDSEIGEPAINMLLSTRDPKRHVTSEQAEAISAAFADNPTPLFLQVALHIAATWESTTAFGEGIAMLEEAAERGLHGIIGLLFTMFEETHGVAFVARALGCITAAREGLSDRELVDLVSCDNHVLKEVLGSRFHHSNSAAAQMERLPDFYWMRLRHAMSEMLTQRRVGSSYVWAWKHEAFGEVARERYLGSEQETKEVHRALAFYFSGAAADKLPNRNISSQPSRFPGGHPNIRKLVELPFHQINAGMQKDCIATLTDMDFLEAKTEGGLIYQLIQDLCWASEVFSPDKFGEYHGFLSSMAATCTAHPTTKLLQAGLNMQPKNPIYRQALESARRAPQALRQSMFLWLNKPSSPTPEILSVAAHSDTVNELSFSEVGDLVVTGSSDKTARVTNFSNGSTKTVLVGHKARLTDCSFSLDGSLVVTGSADGTVRVWDAASGKCKGKCFDQQMEVLSVQLSPDNRLVLFRLVDGSMNLWEVGNKDSVSVLEGHEGPVNECVFGREPNVLVSASDDTTVRIWDANSGDELRTLRGHTAKVNSCSFNHSGELVISGSDDQTVRIWNPISGHLLDTLDEGHSAPIMMCMFSKFVGSYALSASNDGMLRVWDIEGHEALKINDHAKLNDFELELPVGVTRSIFKCEFSPDSTMVAASTDDAITIWSPQNGAKQGVVPGRWVAWAFSSDSKCLVSASADGTLHTWEVSRIANETTYSAHSGEVLGTSMSATGDWAVSCGIDGVLKVWETATGKELDTIVPHASHVTACAISPNDKLILSGHANGAVVLFDRDDKKILHVFKGHRSAVSRLGFRQDGRLICAGSRTGTTIIWDTETATKLRVFHGIESEITACLFSPMGDNLLTSTDRGTVIIYSIADGKVVKGFNPHDAAVCDAQYSAFGDYFVTASVDGTARVFSSKTFTESVQLTGHRSAVTCCSFQPSGRTHMVITTGADGVVKVWDAATGELHNTMVFHGQPFTSLSVAETSCGIRGVVGDRHGNLVFLDQISSMRALK